MIVGITGTRQNITQQQKDVLYNILKITDILILHHGCCVGADIFAHKTAKSFSIKTAAHPPINSKYVGDYSDADIIYPKDEYLSRNKNIVKYSDYVIALPKEYSEILYSGTWATVRYTRKAHKNVLFIYPDGTTYLED